MVTVVAVAVVVVLVAKKVLVRPEAVINMLVEGLVIDVRLDVFADVEVIMLNGVAIALEFAVTVSHAVDVVVQLLIDTLTDIIIGVLLADVIVNVFAAVVLIVLDFTMSTPLEEFNC